MTVEEVARMFAKPRKVGRGKWSALCSAHPDRNRSLSITEGRKGIMLRCWSRNCDVKEILLAVGLTFESLFYDSGRKLTPQQRREAAKRQRDAERKEAQNRKRLRYLTDMVRTKEQDAVKARDAFIGDMANEELAIRWHLALNEARTWMEHWNQAMDTKDRSEIYA